MPAPIPPANISDDNPAEPVSYFTLEERRRSADTKLGGEPLPPLPATHWSNDPVPDEPPVDRRDDGDFFQPEDFFQPTTDGDE
jgi:hypothetical protein